MTLWEKARELERSPWGKIVTVGLVSGNHLLTGQRNDNKLWVSPGGHMDEGEDILSAGRREVLEETGIDISGIDLHLIKAERLMSHRSGKPFVVFALLAHVNKETATGKNDPDKEVSLWKWVPIDDKSPELQMSVRHAKDDFILKHLGVSQEVNMATDPKQQQHPEEKGRTQKQVSDDIQSAGFDPRNPNQPKAEVEPAEIVYPEPGPKTAQEMNEDPEGALNVDVNTRPY